MLAKDHPADAQRDVLDATPDSTPNTARPENAASTDRRTILTDASVRREYALAYRATVDAAYARAEQAAIVGSTDQAEERPSVVDKYPGDYQRPTHDPPRVGDSHVPPENWVRNINLGADSPGRSYNCGECARAVCETWYGKPTAAAALSDPKSHGEYKPRMEEWAGQPTLPVTMKEIGSRLAELGSGSSAIVGCFWNTRGGHWFNAVNDEGAIKAVDGQRNRVGSWPPDRAGVGYNEKMMDESFAIFFDPDGKVLPNDHP